MTVQDVRQIGITIAVPLERAYAFAHHPVNFMRWAAGLANTLHEAEGGWVADTPEGRARVEFSPPNDWGILDHRVRLEGKPEIYVPVRMMANGSGTEVVLTLFRQPGMNDSDFDRDEAAVRRDLVSLKTVLENEARRVGP